MDLGRMITSETGAGASIFLRILEAAHSPNDLFALASINHGFYRVFKENELCLMRCMLKRLSSPVLLPPPPLAPPTLPFLPSLLLPPPDPLTFVTTCLPSEEQPIKVLYEGQPTQCDCCINWVEAAPEELQTAVQSYGSYPLIVRKSKAHNEKDAFMLHSIVVQSPHIRADLKEVFQDYEGIAPDLKELTFTKPFEPIFHRWDQIAAKLASYANDHSSIQSRHFRLFYEMLRSELDVVFRDVDDLISHSVMTIKYVWTLFKPGEIVFSSAHKSAFRVVEGQYQTSSNKEVVYQLRCQFIDFNGVSFGLANIYLTIPAYKGTKEIKKLEVHPFKYHPNPDETKQSLIIRGRNFSDLAGRHLKRYTGTQFRLDRDSTSTLGQPRIIPEKISGRIIIDAESYLEKNPEQVNDLVPLEDEDSPNSELKPSKLEKDSEFMLCSSKVKGYSLVSKQWAEFSIDNISEIDWNKTCFSDLILPNGYKEMLLSLIEEQMDEDDETKFDDYIEGKGKGLIILLSGGTGVGKTLTAETVAESMQSPLYVVSAGELGLDSKSLENNLRIILELASRWKAVLLFDEGDVFLEQRTTSDLERNRLVSIFLRLLEYYTGTLIITTNRASVIDYAVKSRIHISINFPNLDVDARRTVWNNFLQRNNVNHALSEAQINRLAEKNLNGREIKNTIKSATLIARRRKLPLTIEHIRIVVEVLENSKKNEII